LLGWFVTRVASNRNQVRRSVSVSSKPTGRDRADIRDGFIYMGDTGHLDEDAFLFMTDREKDVVFVKGFNVFRREVEEIRVTAPHRVNCRKVGVPERECPPPWRRM
jgi:acyl-CoA synthetase (AMP-forming)/AMP-acid ligase II